MQPKPLLIITGLLFAVCAVGAMGAARAAEQQTAPWFQPSMLAFGDVYYVPKHHLPEAADESGVFLRRLYLTADFEPADSPWRFRVRTETNGPSFDEETWRNQVKDLWVSYDWGAHKVMLGKQPTLTFAAMEEFWGFRTLARTDPDMQGMSSRFNGISFTGAFDSAGRWRELLAPYVHRQASAD